MKKIASVMFFIIISLSLYARPQFFMGGGAEWGKVYPSEGMYDTLRENERYYESGNAMKDSIRYIAFLSPKLEMTVIPFTEFPLGITLSAGYGFVTGVNNGRSTYSYSYGNSNDRYRYGSDDILSLSGGLTYIRLADSDRYFSVSGNVKYNWNRYTLSAVTLNKWERAEERNDMVIDEHSLAAGIGIMGRYDAEYFRVEGTIRKDINCEKGISSLFDGDGWSFSVSMTFGYVFTILNEHQFMR